jgi:hypothetical protein
MAPDPVLKTVDILMSSGLRTCGEIYLRLHPLVGLSVERDPVSSMWQEMRSITHARSEKGAQLLILAANNSFPIHTHFVSCLRDTLHLHSFTLPTLSRKHLPSLHSLLSLAVLILRWSDSRICLRYSAAFSGVAGLDQRDIRFPSHPIPQTRLIPITLYFRSVHQV